MYGIGAARQYHVHVRILWHNSASRRVIAGAMLAIYLACSLGVLPSPALLARWFGHAISEPYPCQEHGCGCEWQAPRTFVSAKERHTGYCEGGTLAA